MKTRFLDLPYPNDEYLIAVGEAVVNFGLVEQGVVHFIDHKEPGFLAQSSDMTAGLIMGKFTEMSAGDENLKRVAFAATNLAYIRNSILHARPAGEKGDEPKLSYMGKEGFHQFTLEDIRRFSEICMPVIGFFNKWAMTVAKDGSVDIDADEFVKNIEPLLQKWKKQRDKRPAQ